MSRALVSLEGVGKRFPSPRRGAPAVTVFSGLDLKIDAGDFVCVVGHSGCGKTTLLNILAGLDTDYEGAVIVGGKEIDGPSLDRAVIFQGHALLPWQSALQAVAYAVAARHRDWSKTRTRERAMEALRLVSLQSAADKRPSELSGGMRQRVGIARALAIEPKMLLMDEPFSALDALTRGTLQDEVRRLCLATGQTVYMITHDVDEAIYLADRIALMTTGPDARIAEVIANPLPRDRTRDGLHRRADYQALRTRLIDFLTHGAGAPTDPAPTPPATTEAAAFHPDIYVKDPA